MKNKIYNLIFIGLVWSIFVSSVSVASNTIDVKVNGFATTLSVSNEKSTTVLSGKGSNLNESLISNIKGNINDYVNDTYMIDYTAYISKDGEGILRPLSNEKSLSFFDKSIYTNAFVLETYQENNGMFSFHSRFSIDEENKDLIYTGTYYVEFRAYESCDHIHAEKINHSDFDLGFNKMSQFDNQRFSEFVVNYLYKKKFNPELSTVLKLNTPSEAIICR